jgi:hypothetical protein
MEDLDRQPILICILRQYVLHFQKDRRDDVRIARPNPSDELGPQAVQLQSWTADVVGSPPLVTTLSKRPLSTFRADPPDRRT